MLAGSIAARSGDRSKAVERFGRAVEREPYIWHALLMLGTLQAQAGDRAAATEGLARALQANPEDPLVRRAARGARSGDPVPLDEIESDLLGRVCDRVGPPAGDICRAAPEG